MYLGDAAGKQYALFIMGVPSTWSCVLCERTLLKHTFHSLFNWFHLPTNKLNGLENK